MQGINILATFGLVYAPWASPRADLQAHIATSFTRCASWQGGSRNHSPEAVQRIPGNVVSPDFISTLAMQQIVRRCTLLP